MGYHLVGKVQFWLNPSAKACQGPCNGTADASDWGDGWMGLGLSGAFKGEPYH